MYRFGYQFLLMGSIGPRKCSNNTWKCIQAKRKHFFHCAIVYSEKATKNWLPVRKVTQILIQKQISIKTWKNLSKDRLGPPQIGYTDPWITRECPLSRSSDSKTDFLDLENLTKKRAPFWTTLSKENKQFDKFDEFWKVFWKVFWRRQALLDS